MSQLPWLTSAVLAGCLLAGCGGKNANSPPASSSPADPPWFTDVTSEWGIHFKHVAGTNYFMPDQVGSGVALFDCDGDGRLDVYFVQNGGKNSPARNQLFLQQADGKFRNASEGSGVDVAGRGMGPIAGDVNNDGRPDLLLTEYGAVRLFQNLGGGKFREVSREAGLDNPRWAAPASFIDYDRDGWLDVVVANYVDYDPTHKCFDVHGKQDFCAPKAFGDTATRLWRNTTREPGAAPRFEDQTERSGLFRAPGVALGLVCADFDGDGWPDIFCSDDGRPNRLFVNQRNGKFAEEAIQRGLAFNAMGAPAANMGTAFGDVDGDLLADLFITHLTEEFHSLYRQGPRGMFVDQIGPSGLQQQAWRGTGFGTVLADFNCDGAGDIVSANGLVRRIGPGHQPVASGMDPWWARYAQKAQLFRNEGGGKFRDISLSQSALCGTACVGRSLAVGDLDNDGAPDLVLCTIGGPARVLRNIAPARGHWLKLRLLLPQQGMRDAIGAEVTVTAGGKKHWAVLQPATSYLANNDPTLHFGLGPAALIDNIEVLWPDGRREQFPGGPANRLMELKKGNH
jgi:enediyne biosynthesis protein E4